MSSGKSAAKRPWIARAALPGELLVADHAAELGEVRAAGATAPEIGRPEVAQRALQHLVPASELVGAREHGVRDARHGTGDYVASASSNCPFAATNAGSVTSFVWRGRGEVDPHVGHDAARPRRHHDDAVGQEQRLLDIVGDEHDGAPVTGPHLLQPLLHRTAGDRVEGAERLVEQEHGSRHEEGAEQRDPLPHATRECRGPRAFEPREAEPLEARGRLRPRVLARSTPATSAPSVAFAITRRHGMSRSCCG